jgi:hypothetical protein
MSSLNLRVSSLPERSILDNILKSVVKSDGKLGGNHEERLKYRDEIIKILSNHLKGFKQGVHSTVYIPPIYPLEGFEYHLKELIKEDARPEEIYTMLTNLLKELQNLKIPKYCSDGHKKAASKCIESAKNAYGGKIYDFVDMYLAINKRTLINIARILTEQPSIQGCISALEVTIEEGGYRDVYQLCKNITLGRSKEDTLIKRIYSLARVYDGLLTILGIACHCDLARRHKRQPLSYILSPTPFTRVFINVMLGNIPAESYIEAYKSFIECATRAYPNSVDYAIAYCSKYIIEKWKYIGIDTEASLIKAPLRALYLVINEIPKDFTY